MRDARIRTERSRGWRTTLVVASVACAMVLGCLALGGCQSPATSGNDQKAADPAPKAQAAEPAAADEKPSAAAASADLPGTFTNPDAGAWGDTQYARAVNAGNRGCNACHADLFSVLPKGMNSKGLHEPDKPAAYGRVYTYNDCTTCHIHSGTGGMNTGGSGPYMAPSIHGSHFANQTFVAQGGNCFSCHETNVDTGELGMWDELKYTKSIGLGNNAPLEVVGTWIAGRGYETSTVTGGMVEHNIKLDNVVSNQDPTDSAKNLYSATNMDYPDLTDENYSVTIKGVKNEKTYTMDDLRAMPQTEFTYTRVCLTNGHNGGWMIANIPTKGVKLSDIIEDCGGLVDGADTFAGTGWDGWSGPPTPGFFGMSIDGYMDPNTMIAIEQFGEPIELIDGGPAYLIVPGGPAFAGSKWIKEINFYKGDGTEATTVIPWGLPTSWGTWLTPSTDGQEFKVGQPIELSGVAFTLAEQGDNKVTAIKVSADYGDTWTEIPLPQNMDVDQWVKWTATWTPEVAGTYCLTLHTDTVSTDVVPNDGNVIIKVTE